MILPYQGTITTGPEPVEIEGETVRNRTIQPCGCWSGEILNSVMVGVVDPATGLIKEFVDSGAKQWQRVNRGCQTHSGEAAVAMLRVAERHAENTRRQLASRPDQNDAVSVTLRKMVEQAALPEHARLFLANRANRILAEAKEVNQALAQLGDGHVTIAMQVGIAVASAEGRLPAHVAQDVVHQGVLPAPEEKKALTEGEET